MFSPPPIPSWEGLHPLVIHFPIGLLAIVPVFVVLALIWKAHRDAFLLAALLTSLGGLKAMYIAILTGRAAAEVADITPEIMETIERHSALAKMAFQACLFYTIALGLVFVVAMFVRPFWKRRTEYIVGAILLAGWAAGYGLISLAGHQGGTLVHKYGVHSSDFNAAE
jgi:uncharacterized membrane protein